MIVDVAWRVGAPPGNVDEPRLYQGEPAELCEDLRLGSQDDLGRGAGGQLLCLDNLTRLIFVGDVRDHRITAGRGRVAELRDDARRVVLIRDEVHDSGEQDPDRLRQGEGREQRGAG